MLSLQSPTFVEVLRLAKMLVLKHLVRSSLVAPR